VTGMHGIGVSAPIAAAVAAATVGFAIELHVPNGITFTIGAPSMMFAAGVPVVTQFVGSTTNEEGAAPKLHFSIAPMQTCIAIFNLSLLYELMLTIPPLIVSEPPPSTVCDVDAWLVSVVPALLVSVVPAVLVRPSADLLVIDVPASLENVVPDVLLIDVPDLLLIEVPASLAKVDPDFMLTDPDASMLMFPLTLRV